MAGDVRWSSRSSPGAGAAARSEAPPRREVELDACAADRVARRTGCGRGDPQPRPDPGDQLGEPKRFGDVVVRSRIESDDHVDLLRTGGEHDDRQCGTFGAHLAADVESVEVGQRQVEQHEVGCVVFEPLERGEAGVDVDDIEPFGAQHAQQRLADAGVVFDEEQGSHH